METKRTCFASVVSISEIEQSEIYLTVKARLFETPGANLNGVRVTAAFLDEIVAHQDAYVCVPVYADVDNLAARNFEHLGHLYNAETGEFHSTMIGSFYKFEKETTSEGSALIGYARIMKRNKAVCASVIELFANNALKLSFEITCGSYQELEDGTMMIDAGKENYLEGMAIVSFPACENAVALQLVAEQEANNEKGAIAMNGMMTDENVAIIASEEIVAETEIAEEAVAETEIAEEVIAEEAVAEEITAEEAEIASCDTEETAETETAEATEVAEEAIAEEETASCDSKKECAEDIPDENELSKEEEETEEVASNQNAELEAALSQITTLSASVEELKTIIAELTKRFDESTAVIAEEEEAPVNMMTAEMKLEDKYSLLNSESRESIRYSLLEKA